MSAWQEGSELEKNEALGALVAYGLTGVYFSRLRGSRHQHPGPHKTCLQWGVRGVEDRRGCGGNRRWTRQKHRWRQQSTRHKAGGFGIYMPADDTSPEVQISEPLSPDLRQANYSCELWVGLGMRKRISGQKLGIISDSECLPWEPTGICGSGEILRGVGPGDRPATFRFGSSYWMRWDSRGGTCNGSTRQGMSVGGE